MTTVRQSLTDVATLATKILLDLLQGVEPEEPHVVFEPRLMVRESTAAPPNHRLGVQKEVSRKYQLNSESP